MQIKLHPSEPLSIPQNLAIPQIDESPKMAPPETVSVMENKTDTVLTVVADEKPQVMHDEVLETYPKQESKAERISDLLNVSESEADERTLSPVVQLESIRGGMYTFFIGLLFSFRISSGMKNLSFIRTTLQFAYIT